MLNEDRHLSNFGIIRDVKTLEWKQVCPIFDTGRSMNTNIYRCPGEDDRPFEVISYGADGEPGGEDENADLSSWE